MKSICVILVVSMLVNSSLGCLLKGCGCGCGGGLGLEALQNPYGYGVGNPYGAYGAAINPYNPYGSCTPCCNPVLACLLKKLKPCLLHKELLAKKMYKKNLLASKLYCGW